MSSKPTAGEKLLEYKLHMTESTMKQYPAGMREYPLMECDYKCMNIPRIVPGGLDGGRIWGLGENIALQVA